ncbi:MAG: hypothetical protein AAF514_14085 [Verrucomicrobiota bacterium]
MKEKPVGESEAGIDFIGDVHGYAEELRALLAAMGYKNRRVVTGTVRAGRYLSGT